MMLRGGIVFEDSADTNNDTNAETTNLRGAMNARAGAQLWHRSRAEAGCKQKSKDLARAPRKRNL